MITVEDFEAALALAQEAIDAIPSHAKYYALTTELQVDLERLKLKNNLPYNEHFIDADGNPVDEDED